MRLTKESEPKKRKQTKDTKKHHHEHVPAYMRDEVLHENSVADLFVKKGK